MSEDQNDKNTKDGVVINFNAIHAAKRRGDFKLNPGKFLSMPMEDTRLSQDEKESLTDKVTPEMIHKVLTEDIKDMEFLYVFGVRKDKSMVVSYSIFDTWHFLLAERVLRNEVDILFSMTPEDYSYSMDDVEKPGS